MTEIQSSMIDVSVVDNVAIIALNRPDSKNAMNLQMRIELVAAIGFVRSQPDCRAVVLTGNQSNFCAGGDIGEVPTDDRKAGIERLEVVAEAISALVDLPVPVIAAVEGIAVGVGVSLLAACDFAIASESSKFSLAFGRIGLMADGGLTWTLPQRVGASLARRLIVSAATLDAGRALEIGLIDVLCQDGDALVEARRLAESLTAVSSAAVAANKRIMRKWPFSLADALEFEVANQAALFQAQDFMQAQATWRSRRRSGLR